MKNFKTLFLTAILIGVCVFNLVAQIRSGKTSSAKAYYGKSPSRNKVKMKKRHKMRMRSHTQPAEGTRGNDWKAYRRRRS